MSLFYALVEGVYQRYARSAIILIIVRGMSRPRPAFSLQSVTERFRRLPCLFIADMGIAHGRADILVAEQLLDFPQILSHLVEEDRGRGVAQPMRGDLPYPERSAGRPQPQVERAI